MVAFYLLDAAQLLGDCDGGLYSFTFSLRIYTFFSIAESSVLKIDEASATLRST